VEIFITNKYDKPVSSNSDGNIKMAFLAPIPEGEFGNSSYTIYL
jgi:hypothetical protein